MLYQDKLNFVEKDQKLRKIAVKFADKASHNKGEVWVQIWELAYDNKIKELRNDNERN